MTIHDAATVHSAARLKPLPDRLTLRSATGALELADGETQVMQLWVRHWLARDPEAMVVMACSAPGGRASRLEKLNAMSGILARSGVERVRFTDDLVEDADAGEQASSSASCTVFLKMVNARRAERQVRSIRSFFESDRMGKASHVPTHPDRH